MEMATTYSLTTKMIKTTKRIAPLRGLYHLRGESKYHSAKNHSANNHGAALVELSILLSFFGIVIFFAVMGLLSALRTNDQEMATEFALQFFQAAPATQFVTLSDGGVVAPLATSEIQIGLEEIVKRANFTAGNEALLTAALMDASYTTGSPGGCTSNNVSVSSVLALGAVTVSAAALPTAVTQEIQQRFASHGCLYDQRYFTVLYSEKFKQAYSVRSALP